MVKHKPPSRIRYEKSHPVISLRVDMETKQRLQSVLDKYESAADFVKEAIGVREREKESLHDQYIKGTGEGFRRGYMQAKETYGVYTHCAKCKEKLFIQEEKEKKEIDVFFRNRGLCHYYCIDEGRGKQMEGG